MNELEKLLNEVPSGKAALDSGLSEEMKAPVSDKSPTALVVDQWGHGQARKLGKDERNKDTEHSENLMADSHTACFDPNPELAENPEDTQKSEWFSQLFETPGFAKLARVTNLDHDMSEMAAWTIANQYKEYALEVDDEPGGRHGGGGHPEGDGDIEGEIRRIKHCNEAVNKVTDDVDKAEEMSAGLGLGDDSNRANSADTVRLFHQVKDDPILMRISELSGRYRRLAQSLQKQKSDRGLDQISGITTGDDFGKMVSSELASLLIPELKMDILRRISDRQAVCRKFNGIHRVGKGPIVICVDESGSMQGESFAHAKALALSLGWIAKHQKRWIGFVGFSGKSTGTRVAFPPNKWDQGKLIEWLTHFYCGGTTAEVPLKTLPEVYWDELGCPEGKTDIVLVTDGELSVSDALRDSFNKWKEEHSAKLHTIVIGHRTGQIQGVSDRIWTTRNLNLKNDCITEVMDI